MKFTKTLTAALLAASLVATASAGPIFSNYSATKDLRLAVSVGGSGQHYAKTDDKLAAGAYTGALSLHYAPVKYSMVSIGLGLDLTASQGNYTTNFNNHDNTTRAYVTHTLGGSLLFKQAGRVEVAPYAKVGGGYVYSRFNRYNFREGAHGMYGSAAVGAETVYGAFLEANFNYGKVKFDRADDKVRYRSVGVSLGFSF